MISVALFAFNTDLRKLRRIVQYCNPFDKSNVQTNLAIISAKNTVIESFHIF